MKLERFTIEQLAGIATNPAEGVAQQAPSKATAFFDRVGGYRAMPSSANLITVGNSYDFNAASGDGWAFLRSGSDVKLLNGLTDSYTTGHTSVGNPVSFIPGAGYYEPDSLLVGDFEFYAEDGTVFPSATWGGLTTITVPSIGASAGGSLSAGEHQFFIFSFLNTRAGRALLNYRAYNITVSSGDYVDIQIDGVNSSNIFFDVYVSHPGSKQYRFWTSIPSTSLPVTLTYYDELSIGPLLPAYDRAAIVLGQEAGTSVVHKRRVYGLFNGESYISEESTATVYPASGEAEVEAVATEQFAALPANAVVYTEIGYVNFYGEDNWFVVPSSSGGSVTALASSPAGLLVFLNDESYLVRGDPDGGDFAVQLLSGTLGVDHPRGVAAMGGIVFVVANTGEVYQIVLGMGDVDFGQGVNRISDPVFDPEDHFYALGVDYDRNQLVASTVAGVTYRYDAQVQQWATDPLSGTALEWLIPNPDSSGLRYAVSDSDVKTLTGSLSNIELDFEALDLGDKNLLKMWRRVEVFTDAAYAGTPTMQYTVRGSSATVNGIDQGDGRWVFTFGPGVVGPTVDLEFTFPSVTASTVIEPPLHIYYVPRYREV